MVKYQYMLPIKGTHEPRKQIKGYILDDSNSIKILYRQVASKEKKKQNIWWPEIGDWRINGVRSVK